ncbi:hypothetical protein CLV30_12842 [Haloactinopolyspora alba]|uniref:Uncharacterized protein n=1 Tax=Haloactinopolyspora alba TaxID=648780 RepID=A0A2P8DF02_9ACTN|nr:hypothetical protein [Haloactinopolyspora alba]PSK95790.1 hypothetical protein CLV30_12842 [Haloactinopolyspora alba]
MTRQLPDGVKPTSGGKYDPDATWTYFLAGDIDHIAQSQQPHVLVAVNEIENDKDATILDRLCDERAVLLDSGIFNLAMSHARAHEVSHDDGLSMPPEEIDGFDDLWDRYAQIVDRYADRLWGVIELDQGGVEHKPRTRARIETELGITPMPVYHPMLDGWDYYDTLAGEYDRLCFGNLVKAPAPTRMRLVWTMAERAKAYPYLWTHLLGVSPSPTTLAMPYRGSCDSSSWLTGLRWLKSWHSWALLDHFADFPPDMWYSRDEYERGVQIISNTAMAVQHTIDAAREDTHPWP